jgi:uncharacterized protein
MIFSFLVRQMVYPAPPVRVPSPPPEPFEEVWLDSGGVQLSAWWLPPPDGRPGAPVALMLHGNGENLETMRRAGLFHDFQGLGVGVLALDYPGYGRSGGTSREDDIIAGTDVAWSWLEQRAGDRPKALVGWSLGAAVAIEVAARRGEAVDGLVLLSPWDSLEAVARAHFPGPMVGWLLRERYDSVEAAGSVAASTLVIHGADDRIIPVELGRAVYEALPEPKLWVELPGVGHNDLLAQPVVWHELGRFLGSLVGESEPESSGGS